MAGSKSDAYYQQNVYQNDRRTRHHRSRNGDGRANNNGRNYIYKKTIDIDTDCIGIIIGKGGSNIQRLQSSCDVRVIVDTFTSTVTVSGKDNINVLGAVHRIKSQIHDFRSGSGRSDRSYKHCNTDDEAIDWTAVFSKKLEEKLAKLPPLTKNFYHEHPEVANLSKHEIDRLRLVNGNTTVLRTLKLRNECSDVMPKPIWKFKHCFGAYPDLMNEISRKGLQKPSPIQAQGWPILLKGEDMIGIVQSDTGNTLAFLFPAFIHTEFQSIPRSQRSGPTVLVLVPTRELAIQIEKEVNKYQFRDIKAAYICGGGNGRDKAACVETGAEVIISTPDRLFDLKRANVVDLSTITFVVLHEVDRMLDLGFSYQIRLILADIRPDRQTVMTSAALTAAISNLAELHMTNPIQVHVGSSDSAVTNNVQQVIEILEEDDKYYAVKNFINNMTPNESVLIICSQKKRVCALTCDLSIDGHTCDCIFESKEQSEQEKIVDDMTSGYIKILIATDVASRRFDIDVITHVINYDFPRDINEYYHRVSHTGRAGRRGILISYLMPSELAVAPELITILEKCNQYVPYDLRGMADRFRKVKETKRNSAKGQHHGRFR